METYCGMERYKQYEDGVYELSVFFAKDAGIRCKTLAERIRTCKPNSPGHLAAREEQKGGRRFWYIRAEQKEAVKERGKTDKIPRFQSIDGVVYEHISPFATDVEIDIHVLVERIRHDFKRVKINPSYTRRYDVRRFKVGLKEFLYININDKNKVIRTRNCTAPEFVQHEGVRYQKLTGFANATGKGRSTLKFRLEHCLPSAVGYVRGRKFRYGLVDYRYVDVRETERIKNEGRVMDKRIGVPEFMRIGRKQYQRLPDFADATGRNLNSLKSMLVDPKQHTDWHLKGRKFRFGNYEYWYADVGEKGRMKG